VLVDNFDANGTTTSKAWESTWSELERTFAFKHGSGAEVDAASGVHTMCCGRPLLFDSLSLMPSQAEI
jgi:hypothetical protein